MNKYELQLATGVDIPIPECQLTLHQPSIKEIGAIGEQEFFTGVQLICLQKDPGRIDLNDITNFQIFMTILADKEAADKKKIVLDTMFILFPNYKVTVTPRSLLLNLGSEMSIIDENNFSSLQDVLRQVVCLSSKSSDSFNPANEAAAAIAKKLERGRQRVAAQKQGADGGSSVFSQYLSVLTVGLHIPLQNLLDLTIYQLYDLIERYTLFVNWDLDVRSRLAGGKPDNQPDNWMKIIH